MKKPVATMTVTQTSRAVRVSVIFVVISAAGVVVFSLAALASRMFTI